MMVITMASYALQTPPWVAHAKPPGPKRLNIGNNNGQLRIANAISGGARKAAWANNNIFLQYGIIEFKSGNGRLFRFGFCAL